ncbi:MAG: glyoxalase/bleomycin resistance/dioxygenase family protein [Pseudomonadales bacterium]
MKRMHIHINAEAANFAATRSFYATLFNCAPTKSRTNYAKWMLDDPHVNFVIEVIEVAGDVPGIHHVGIQVDDSNELQAIRDALRQAEAPLLEIGETVCCFSKSEKNWTMDPAGVRWETFRSFGDTGQYGEKTLEELANYSKPSV